jgi:hypothetical protein
VWRRKKWRELRGKRRGLEKKRRRREGKGSTRNSHWWKYFARGRF